MHRLTRIAAIMVGLTWLLFPTATTRGITPSSLSGAQSTLAEAATPYAGRLWDGNNPFHQPAATSNYYGSGDANNDGIVTSADVALARKMADGHTSPAPRADVDSSGQVTPADADLIAAALQGDPLPGWWNQLPTRAARNAWVDQILAIDQTDQHPYHDPWFICYQYVRQLFIHSTGYRDDLYWTGYDAGQPRFNLPMYTVSVNHADIDHALNAILVGDDPLDFADWRFIEPQTDADARPGMWNMPYGAELIIQIPSELGFCTGNCPRPEKLRFRVTESGGTLERVYDSDFRTTRPTPPAHTPDNAIDRWNPVIIPVDAGTLLFEQSRADMSGTTDLHLADPLHLDAATPLIGEALPSRLLDLVQADDGTIHLLWKGRPDYSPGVFHGILDPAARRLRNITRVTTERMPDVRMGRLVITPTGERHAFWFQGHPLEKGIYWSQWSGTGWQPRQNLTPEIQLSGYPGTVNRDFNRYRFDVMVASNGDLLFAWVDRVSTWDNGIRTRRFTGAWSAPTVIADDNTRGLDLVADTTGTLHLIAWSGPAQTYYSSGSRGRGNLRHHTLTGTTWSAPTAVSSATTACCTRMVADSAGAVYLVWEQQEDDHVVPAWSRYANGTWEAPQTVPVPAGSAAWYPTAALLPNGTLILAWSSRSATRVTLTTHTVAAVTPPTATATSTPTPTASPAPDESPVPGATATPTASAIPTATSTPTPTPTVSPTMTVATTATLSPTPTATVTSPPEPQPDQPDQPDRSDQSDQPDQPDKPDQPDPQPGPPLHELFLPLLVR